MQLVAKFLLSNQPDVRDALVPYLLSAVNDALLLHHRQLLQVAEEVPSLDRAAAIDFITLKSIITDLDTQLKRYDTLGRTIK